MGLPVEIDPLLIASSATGYTVNNSLRLRSSASAYLSRTPASTTNQKTFTISLWVKRGTLGSSTYNTFFYAGANSTYWFGVRFGADSIQVTGTTSGGSTAIDFTTNAVYRDPSSWYYVVIAIDTTQATAANRQFIYVNGVSQTLTQNTQVAQNTSLAVNQNVIHTIGVLNYATANYFDGYLAEYNFIDGQALTPTSFGAYNTISGVWQPIKYAGTYGTNGFYLKFNNTASTTTLGYDSSGNSNNWTCNNISLTAGSTYDAMIDSPTLSAAASNYAVINPLDHAGTAATISNGNLYYVGSASSVTRSTLGITNAKVYWEITQVSSVNGSNPIIYGSIGLNGVVAHSASSQSVLAYTDNGSNKAFRLTNSSGITSTITPSSFTLSVGDVLQIAYDGTTGKIWIGKNNTYYDGSGGTTGNPSTGANAVFTVPDLTNPMAPGFDHAGVSYTCTLNCGQQPFAYTPPTGYSALNTYNLPTPAIANGALYNAATLYTGNSGGSLNILNSQSNGGNNALGKTFEPDFLWIKNRSYTQSNTVYDTVRGVYNILITNSTVAEDTETAGHGLSSFNSNGFSIVGDTVNQGGVNSGTYNYVAWQWNAGSGTSGSNTNGSITSTVSVNQTAGFSIVTYTGTGSAATVGHGLGVAPSMIITKKRSSTSDWGVYHTSIGNTNYLLLDSTAASASSSTYWNNTSPTSSVFSIGTADPVNVNTATYVAYCFAPIAGYSAFGIYTGNGSTDGPFVYCGFRPRWVMVKSSTVSASSSEWLIKDTSRDTYNVMQNTLTADSSQAEFSGSNQYIDILSNGFKIRNATGAYNNSTSDTYIYAAFAENPFKYALAR